MDGENPSGRGRRRKAAEGGADPSVKKPRKPSPTIELARWFVSEILGETFDYRFSIRYMSEAKRLVNPDKEGEEPLDIETVRRCILALKEGVFEFDAEIKSLWVVTYGKPPYYSQFRAYAKNPPPCWNAPAVRQWERLTGQVAYPPKSNDGMMVDTPTLPNLQPPDTEL